MEKERTLAYHNPELIKEWHPTLNKDKTPYNTTCGSGYKAWWILRYYDAQTGKIFDFEWQAAVYHRSKGEKCPYLAGKKVYTGFNDFATICPELKKQVHPEKNKGLKSTDILAFSNKKIWWLYLYNDSNTGKHFDFEWEATPASRIANSGCPFLSNQRIWSGFNDLKTRYPRIASEWNYKKNKKKPEEYIKFYLDIFSSVGDLILDYHLGSGTTCAVAHKLGRRYIGVEQMDYIENVSVERLKNVINGEQSGISKIVNWQGGGSFVYCELLENAANLITKIQTANENSILLIKEEIYKDERIIPYITREELQKVEEEFENLGIEEKKIALINLVDKNKLYVNYSDMEDKNFNVCDADKSFTKSLYKEV